MEAVIQAAMTLCIVALGLAGTVFFAKLGMTLLIELRNKWREW